MLKILKCAKINFYVFCFIMSAQSLAWSTDDAKKTVTSLVTQIQSIVKSKGSQDQYKPVLLKYLDFDEISKRVLAGVKRQIINDKGQKEANEKIADFLPKFIPVFTDYMIKKYSNPEVIVKFENMTFEIDKVVEGNKFISVFTTFKSDQNIMVESKTLESKFKSDKDMIVEWKTLKSNSKIIDMIFSDASASFFKNEISEATSKYKRGGSNLNELLKQYN